MPASPRVVVRESAPELWRLLLGRWREAAREAVLGRGRFVAALSGGRTPEGFYRELASAPGLPWQDTHLFLVDERLVPEGSLESNAALIRASLVAGLPAAPGSLHLPPAGVLQHEAAAELYEGELRRFFGRGDAVFDLVLLGLGADGHTASLFPGTSALEERTRLVVGLPAIPGRLARVSLSLRVLDAARRVIFLVSGSDKRAALGGVLAGDPLLPGALVRPVAGTVEILADRAAFPAGA